MNASIYDKLIQVAKARTTITYGELAKVADMLIDDDQGVKRLGLLLDEIADQEIAAGRPLLPVVIVRENNMPGAGLFKYARRKKLQKTDDLTYFATELKRVYDYWATAEPG